MSRATSYDPFASSNRSSSIVRSTGLASSDYTPKGNYTNRYGSTEQLSSYRPSAYRSGSISSGSATSSSYTPRNARAGSVSIGAYDPPNRSHSDALSRYHRPANTDTYTPSLSRYRSTDLSSTSDYSTSKYRSPENSYSSSRCSSTVSNRYSSSSSSKTSPYSSRTSTSSSYRSDRDYRSMSRTENEEEDEVESTFRKLYRKYVTDSEPDLSKNDKFEGSLAEKVSRRFESKSEAEEEESDLSISEEDDDEILSKYQSKGLRRASSASSITPRASVCNSPSKDVTPKCSPLPARKDAPIPNLVSESESEVEEEAESIDMKPLTRSFHMQATFGALMKDSEELLRTVTASEHSELPEVVKKDSAEAQKTSKNVQIKTSDVSKESEDVLKFCEVQKVSEDVKKDPECAKKNSEDVKSVAEAIFPKIPIETVKKVAASIKINGIPVKMENGEEKGEKGAVRIRIRADKSPSRDKEVSPPENLISTAANVVLQQEDRSDENLREFSKEKSSESDTTTTSSRASSLRKRRDPNRTLENLQSILKAEKMKDSTDNSEESEEKKVEKTEENEVKSEEKNIRRIPIPLVLITEPSNPSTPLATTPVTTAASICLWNKRSSSSTEEEGDEDEYEVGFPFEP
ncbi:unnamed protein product [Caenorhabditis sp. 36 PRJEB53466]|nr:unnamed protein product [Caenorhabditis sp. 36 PRJEB53466]